MLIEQHDQRDRVRPEMGARRPEGIRGLPRVAALHASTAVATPAHMHIEATHVWPHDRQVLLNLGGDAGLGQPATAMRARLGEGNVDPFVNRSWRLSVRMSPVSASGATSRRPRLRCRRAFRERRRLTLAGASRRLERSRQPLDIPLQSISIVLQSSPIAFQPLPLLLQLVPIALQLLTLSLQPRVVLTESFRFLAGLLDLTPQSLPFTLRVIARARGRALRHATVMADSRKKYKPKLWIGVVNPLTSYRCTSGTA